MGAKTQDQQREGVRSIIAEYASDPSRVSDEATLEVLDVDSLDMIDIAVQIDEAFGTSISDKEWMDASLETVGDVTDFVLGKLP